MNIQINLYDTHGNKLRTIERSYSSEIELIPHKFYFSNDLYILLSYEYAQNNKVIANFVKNIE